MLILIDVVVTVKVAVADVVVAMTRRKKVDGFQSPSLAAWSRTARSSLSKKSSFSLYQSRNTKSSTPFLAQL